MPRHRESSSLRLRKSDQFRRSARLGAHMEKVKGRGQEKIIKRLKNAR
jgi:hypothetical protein